MSGAKVMSKTPRTPFACVHMMVEGASITIIPGTTSVRPIHAITSETGPKSQRATENLCQPSSKTRIPRPLSAWANCHPPASTDTRGHHLHVKPGGIADLPRLNHPLEHP